MRFLLAVRKHNFLRTSPAEARNALIRMPAEMKRDGAGVRHRRSSSTGTDALESALPQIHKRANMRNNKAKSEWTGCTQASDKIYTPSFTGRSGVRIQLCCTRWAYSEPDTWDTSSRVLSLTKWILHSADMWYLNFPLGGGICVWMKKLSDACSFHSKQWMETLLHSCSVS